jgi:HNH endonuclease
VARTVRPAEDRFWAKVNKTETCWLWTGATTRKGYGLFGVAHSFNRQVHRFSYELLKGAIPPGFTLDHLCSNRACVNPDHLEPVTQRVNVYRGNSPSAINRKKTECKYGHPLSGSNLKISIAANGSVARSCRTCHNEANRERKRRKRAA